jgi:hypothetical protein
MGYNSIEGVLKELWYDDVFYSLLKQFILCSYWRIICAQLLTIHKTERDKGSCHNLTKGRAGATNGKSYPSELLGIYLLCWEKTAFSAIHLSYKCCQINSSSLLVLQMPKRSICSLLVFNCNVVQLQCCSLYKLHLNSWIIIASQYVSHYSFLFFCLFTLVQNKRM